MIPLLPFKKTRIAPTPSGFLHLGNLLSFVLTAALARRNGASILLRIDDLDRERYHDDYVLDILDTLNFMEIPWDEGPRTLSEFRQQYSQTHRLHLYQHALDQLRSTGQVFACSCSRSLLNQLSPDGSYPGTCTKNGPALSEAQINWRLHTSPEKQLMIHTLEQGNISTALPALMQFFVVRKKNGIPSYQLSSLIDDIHFGVDFIVRGNDLWHSSLAQTYLSELISTNDFGKAGFYHHDLLHDSEGTKLSKTAGSISIQYLRKEGMKKEEIYQHLAEYCGLQAGTIKNWETFAIQYFETKQQHQLLHSPADAD
ncbi:tRNA glutamyl-Q synthetase [Pseudoflavitalea sp. G-6-1-2]|uniref:glutamate--tRNA ligase family protein n=1 Tax=Pseudoflavitalea sp. G-6-1-2 TaxID=2728841 RepID=UPI00146C4B6E|nr:glutamate--tRNA ligase family protein [Pseudoflavitalea sp. G-6-1-2]NML22907.1 tRNA glutamyl-Q synthetase [Pseudoflavitalea sp. G-6-1-2]